MQTIKLLFISILFLGLSSCGLNRKAQVEALGKCDYSIASVSQVRVAGRAIESFQDGGGVSLSSLPGIAMALLTKDLPLEAKVNLKVSNPTNTRASINQFKYIIEIQGKPLVEGTVNENVLPTPYVLSTVIFPSIRSISLLLIASPRPVPSL